ncbi:MAG: thioredoxin family protein [Bacteroidota bacterium]
MKDFNTHFESAEEFFRIVKLKPAVLCYFSYEDCGVCRVLKPKVIELVENEFPKVDFLFIDTRHNPEIAAQNQVFTVPTILFFIDGKEYFRLGRNFGLEELSYRIERIYGMLYR